MLHRMHIVARLQFNTIGLEVIIMTIGDSDKGQTRSEWWLSKLYPLLTSEEEIGSTDLPNDTAENTIVEITNATRMKIDAVWLDFTTLVQNVTIKVYHKIDGTTYRQYDEFAWATTQEDGTLISDITINNDWKLTVTSDVSQGGVKAIPYNVIKHQME